MHLQNPRGRRAPRIGLDRTRRESGVGQFSNFGAVGHKD